MMTRTYHGGWGQGGQAPPQLPDVVETNTPEELAPLVDALERARAQQDEATGIREALEAEVHACTGSSLCAAPIAEWCLSVPRGD